MICLDWKESKIGKNKRRLKTYNTNIIEVMSPIVNNIEHKLDGWIDVWKLRII